tara:strand:+ start:39985 stop:40866 length:882 start_codon:yes stop_codon:yes gene_type:complete
MISNIYLLWARLLFKKERKPVLEDLAAWRKRHPIRDTDSDKMVTYLVPIFERKRAPNWSVVQTNLTRTISALRRQSDPRWRMIICSQDFPDQIAFDDHVQFLKYPASHNGSPDKVQKLRFMARYLAKTEKRDGYAFFLDGDDIPHPDLTRFILEDDNGHGYYLPKGYCFDAGERCLLRPLEEEGDTHTFAWLCGSSHAVRFDTRFDRSQTVHVSLRGDHMQARQNLKSRVGLVLKPVPFPAMIYIVNHGSSDQDILAESDGRKRAHAGLKEVKESEIDDVLGSFGTSVSELSR